MIDLRCTTDKYGELYAPWLDNPGKLLDMANLQAGERVLDLCGGTGIVATEALNRGALTAYLLDLNPYRCEDRQVVVVEGKAERAGQHLAGLEFDLVVRRQAMCYLPLRKTLRAVLDVLRPGGRFVFNAPTNPCSQASVYNFAGSWYGELSMVLGRRVIHLQARWPVGLDVSSFLWFSPADVIDALRPLPYTDTVVNVMGSSGHYLLWKPADPQD